MPLCLECGKNLPRLQWTHFRYNCTGRFKNGVEYRKVYPNAKLVDDDVAKRATPTKERMVSKYGEEEGILRWDLYRKKQAESNSFDYKHAKHGWSREQFDEYNSSRAQTLKKMIERHGEGEGVRLWERYVERQRYTNTLQYFVERYGKVEGAERLKVLNAQKRAANDPMALSEVTGVSLDEAVRVITNRYRLAYSSKLELKFTQDLEERIGGALQHTSTRSPFGKWVGGIARYVVYDIVHDNCVIEFNGDYWHANPKIYPADFIVRGTRAAEIWEKDEAKLQTARECGFRVAVVWEGEYRQNPTKTILRIAEWMQNGQE